MKLYSFQIKNFRSITDSGECIVEPKVSILAGKNESGKSNILIALSKFSSEKYESIDQNLFENSEKEIEIVTKWIIEEDNIKSFQNLKTTKFPSKNECSIIITKKLSKKGCESNISGSFFEWVNKIAQENKTNCFLIMKRFIPKYLKLQIKMKKFLTLRTIKLKKIEIHLMI